MEGDPGGGWLLAEGVRVDNVVCVWVSHVAAYTFVVCAHVWVWGSVLSRSGRGVRNCGSRAQMRQQQEPRGEWCLSRKINLRKSQWR